MLASHLPSARHDAARHATLRESPDRWAGGADRDCLRDIHRSDASLRNLIPYYPGDDDADSPVRPSAPAVIVESRPRDGAETGELSIFHWAFRRSTRSGDAAILPRFHLAQRWECAACTHGEGDAPQCPLFCID